MKKRLLATLAIPAMLAACASSNTAQVATEQVLTNNNWVLTQVDSEALSLPEQMPAPNLELGADMNANGFAGCNRYFGQAEVKEGKVRIDKMGMTMMACSEPEMQLENTFAKTLSVWSEASIQGDELVLKGAEHTLTFVRKAK
ncbi:heat-shock protein HslJ [Photobacterium jeanii]|uniref:Heat-shock protein HslJ n=1 Tax=Photobacterium jeanii TaxID=858640 RepID=A0A178K9H4_9GAMM|nr:META domain-containing protein [Photobacterium jeanii]OAN13767.1 heat-shock protein HslJ [Photobacterium jeanii]PST88888.1 META domain-containing protein [Photobacterium jeanii]